MSTHNGASQSVAFRAVKNCAAATNSSTYSSTAMRRRLNTTHGFQRRCVSEPRASRVSAGADHGMRCFRGARKEKPGGGNAGSDFFVIGVYGFKYAAWLVLVTPEGAERLVLIVQPTFFSCSSTFLFFCNVSKFNRTLCDFASFSVCLRTHSSLGGDDSYKARHMPRNKIQL